MAVHAQEDRMPKKGIRDNGQFGVWLGLLSFTFFFAVFIVSNVYLRGWSPEVFTIELPPTLQNLVYDNLVLLIVMGAFSLAGGICYRKRKDGWAAALLATACAAAIGYLILDWTVIEGYRALGPAAWTAYVIVHVMMEGLVGLCVILYGLVFYRMMQKKEAVLNRLIPGATAVWLYTLIMGFVVFVQCDVVDIGQFGEWCGVKLSQIGK